MDVQIRLPRVSGREVKFLVLTFLIVVILAILFPEPYIVSFLIGAIIAYALLAARSRGGDSGPRSEPHPPPRDHFTSDSALGTPPPYAVAVAAPTKRSAAKYPGAVDFDEYDTEGAYGHRDRTEGDNDVMPVGNPYNRSRIAAPAAAGPCIDDEANDAEMDVDELNTYQVRSRNDAERVTAGTMNRRRDMDKYFRQEVEEAEDREWWGRHEE